MVLMPLAHRIPLRSLRVDFRRSALCLAVTLFVCFHQLLDKGSMMAIMALSNVIIQICDSVGFFIVPSPAVFHYPM
ncbi:hypothetical protein STEG23_003188 [Scotinomys teguina]